DPGEVGGEEHAGRGERREPEFSKSFAGSFGPATQIERNGDSGEDESAQPEPFATRHHGQVIRPHNRGKNLAGDSLYSIRRGWGGALDTFRMASSRHEW